MAQDNPFNLKAHHVTATVIDLERAATWYQDVLGFQLVEKGSRENGTVQFAELQIAGFGIGLVQTSANPANTLTRTAGLGWLHIVFSVPDPGFAFHALKQKGVPVTLPRQSDHGTISSFLIHDSEGNEIEILPR